MAEAPIKTLQVTVKDKHSAVVAGQRFGRLVVIDSFVADQRTKWNCRCDCGKTAVAESRKLVSGHKRSCGCLAADPLHMAQMVQAATAATVKSVTGLRFGRLLVGRLVGQSYECACDCGTPVLVRRRSLVNGDTKSCGCLFVDTVTERAVLRRRAAGLPEDQPMSPASLEARNQFRTLSAEIKARDGYSCVLCGAHGVRLNTHHIEAWSAHPELRFDRRNLVTLCRDCHLNKAHGGNFHGPLDEHIAEALRQCVCGAVHDRDVNAALVIRGRGLATLAEGAVL